MSLVNFHWPAGWYVMSLVNPIGCRILCDVLGKFPLAYRMVCDVLFLFYFSLAYRMVYNVLGKFLLACRVVCDVLGKFPPAYRTS